MNKTQLFSDGTFITASDSGEIKKATKNEVVAFLSSQFPASKSGAELEGVRFDSESGYAYARYANQKVFKKRIAQSAPVNQSEPVDSGDRTQEHGGKSEKFDTPRNESKSKPEKSDRKDVDNPTKIRNKNYEPGKDNVHTDEVPRSKSNSGLKGSKGTTFDEEKSHTQKSGNPDSYVQDFSSSEKPTPAGKEGNHAVANTEGVQIKSSSDMYGYKSVMGGKDEDKEGKGFPFFGKGDKEDKEDKEDKAEKDADKTEKSSKDDKKEEGEKKESKAESQLSVKVAELQGNLSKLSKELDKGRIREARRNAAVKLVLAKRDRNPEKFLDGEVFLEEVNKIAKKMSVEAIETAIEEIGIIRLQEVENSKAIKEAAAELRAEPNRAGLMQSLVVPQDNYKFASKSNESSLSEVLMAHTKFGKDVEKMRKYHEEN